MGSRTGHFALSARAIFLRPVGFLLCGYCSSAGSPRNLRTKCDSSKSRALSGDRCWLIRRRPSLSAFAADAAARVLAEDLRPAGAASEGAGETS